MIALPGQPLDYSNPSVRGLEGYYDFSQRGGYVAADRSGKNRNGIIANLNFAGGPDGSAMVSSSTGSGYVQLPGPPFDFTTQDFSVSVAFVSRSNAVRVVIGNYVLVSNGWGLLTLTNGQLSFRTNQSGAFQETTTSVGAFPYDQLVIAQVTRVGASVRISVNGVDRTDTAGTHINPTLTNRACYLGTYPGNVGSTTYGWIGGLGQVRIYARSPVEGEVSRIAAVMPSSLVRPNRLFPQQSFLANRMYHQRQQQGLAA